VNVPPDTTNPFPRVVFARSGVDDLDDLLALWNDGRVMQWVGFWDGLGWGRDDVEAWLERMEGLDDRRHFTLRTPGGDFCGECFYRVRGHRAELDIKLMVEWQGQGLAQEAFRRLITMVFRSESEVTEIYTEPNKRNEPAQRLYARCGLSPEPRPEELPQAESYWVLRRTDWEPRHKPI
jgi:RimJ/RimL family protein N-acetyltransferase